VDGLETATQAYQIVRAHAHTISGRSEAHETHLLRVDPNEASGLEGAGESLQDLRHQLTRGNAVDGGSRPQ
jgi:hypothetical protein